MDQIETPAIRRLSEKYLPEKATAEEIWTALRLNIQAWCERSSIANQRDDIGHAGGLQWTYNQVTIPSEKSMHDDKQIDDILDWYRERHHLSRANGSIFWFLHPTPPGRLGARLLARGVGPNWRPLWMWCELPNLHPAQDVSTDVEVQIAGEYHSSVKQDAIMEALYHIEPRRVWHISASRPGQNEIGGCTINITTGEFGIGGLFDLWVDPSMRKQGIGSALVRSACLFARGLGCHHVVVNSTEMGESTYRRVGFQSMGYGYTWFLSSKAFKKPAHSSDMVKFLEAIGTGDVKSLDRYGKSLPAAQLQDPSLNDKTPLEIAVLCKQKVSATWLLDHGVTPDIMSLWDLDFKERISPLLLAHPELVNRTGGRWTATPLHYAIERDDMELLKALLTVPNDLDIRDRVFDSTPLGWARHFKRPEMLELLEAHQGATSLEIEEGETGG